MRRLDGFTSSRTFQEMTATGISSKMRSTLGGTTEGLAAPEVSSSARDATDAFVYPSSPVSPTHLRAHGQMQCTSTVATLWHLGGVRAWYSSVRALRRKALLGEEEDPSLARSPWRSAHIRFMEKFIKGFDAYARAQHALRISRHCPNA